MAQGAGRVCPLLFFSEPQDSVTPETVVAKGVGGRVGEDILIVQRGRRSEGGLPHVRGREAIGELDRVVRRTRRPGQHAGDDRHLVGHELKAAVGRESGDGEVHEAKRKGVARREVREVGRAGRGDIFERCILGRSERDPLAGDAGERDDVRLETNFVAALQQNLSSI